MKPASFCGEFAVAPRAIWKGYLKVGELLCPVALHTAVSASERIALHMLNRKTGHRLQRQFVDSETGRDVERDEQVKGYETGPDQYVVLEPEEIAAALPESDKTLSVDCFIPCDQIDTLYFDRPYYLAPATADADQAYAVLRDGLRKKKVAALANAILFRRVRTVLIRPYEDGLIATTLNFDYEVRSAKDAFDKVPATKIKKEMLDLARHIIETKKGSFDPGSFDDKYEAALVELVQAKMEGREIAPPKPPASDKVIDLMEALRLSAGGKEKPVTGKSPAKRGAKKTTVAKAKQLSKKTSKPKKQPKAAQRKAPQRKAG